MLGLKMLIERRIASPLFDKRKIGGIFIIFRKLVSNAAVLGASGLDQIDERLAGFFDHVRFRRQMCDDDQSMRFRCFCHGLDNVCADNPTKAILHFVALPFEIEISIA